MPAATTKDELVAATAKEFDKLQAVLDRVPDDLATAKDGDDTSITDVVNHRAHWIDLFLGWYRDGVAGLDVEFPAPGYKWNELPRYNADLRAHDAAVTWPEARARLTDGHARLCDFIAALDDDALYGGPMPGARNNWPTGRWAESAGPSHYRSAAKYVRGRLR